MNGCHLFDIAGRRGSGCKSLIFRLRQNVEKPAWRAFAQILGKLYFVQLGENLRRILVDYGQKRPRRTNAAFNAAC
jgi:hypothetical protein